MEKGGGQREGRARTRASGLEIRFRDPAELTGAKTGPRFSATLLLTSAAPLAQPQELSPATAGEERTGTKEGVEHQYPHVIKVD